MRREAARVASVSASARSIKVGPRVLTVKWKLPARLRRPVKRQLARQHRSNTSPEVVKFARHKLYSSDIHQSLKPQLRIETPPYFGSAARALPIRRANKIHAPVVNRLSIKGEQAKHETVVPAKTPVKPALTARLSPLTERDIPFDLMALKTNTLSSRSQADQQVVALPRGRFSLPLHFSVWPFRHASRVIDQTKTDKKKLHSSVIEPLI